MKTKRPATLGALREVMQASIRKIGQEFTEADDDWVSVIATQNADGVSIGVLPNELLATDRSKEALGELLRLRMRLEGVYRYALLLNAHGVRVEGDADSTAVRDLRLRIDAVERLEHLPESFEQLVLSLGDAEQEEVWMAEIKTNERGVRYHLPWEKAVGHWEGRFAGLNEYLR